MNDKMKNSGKDLRGFALQRNFIVALNKIKRSTNYRGSSSFLYSMTVIFHDSFETSLCLFRELLHYIQVKQIFSLVFYYFNLFPIYSKMRDFRYEFLRIRFFVLLSDMIFKKKQDMPTM